MTTLAHPTSSTLADSAAAAARTRRLRTLLQADAAFCGVFGAVAAVAAPAAADLLGPDVSTTVVRVVGIALVVWALDAALLSRASGRLLMRAAAVAAAGNVAWEVATIVLIARGAFSTGGAVAALGIAAIAGVLGLLQIQALRGR